MFYEFEIIGKITGKARPKVNTYTMRAYTPAQTKDYENLIKQYFVIKYPKYVPLESRIKVTIVAYFSILKSTSKINTEKMLNQNFKIWKEIYENFYGIPLEYTTKVIWGTDSKSTN